MADKAPGEFLRQLREEQDSPKAKTLNQQEKRRFDGPFHPGPQHSEGWKLSCREHGPLQFPFRPLWDNVVKPLMDRPLVQAGLDAGMRYLDPSWSTGDSPWELGQHSTDWKPAPKKGSLDFYQAQNRCYNLVLCSVELGKLIYKDLSWKVFMNHRHCIAVGIDPVTVLPEDEKVHEFKGRGEVLVCMDLLFSDRGYEARQSLDFADPSVNDKSYFSTWPEVH